VGKTNLGIKIEPLPRKKGKEGGGTIKGMGYVNVGG
jgi:hypothetical protein